jgi:hypothetical protein
MAKKLMDTVQLKLRFPEAIRRQLERAAATNKRSMNSEIVSRLEASFRREENEKLIAETVERTVAALQAAREANPLPPPAPPSEGGLFGGAFSKKSTEPAKED